MILRENHLLDNAHGLSPWVNEGCEMASSRKQVHRKECRPIFCYWQKECQTTLSVHSK